MSPVHIAVVGAGLLGRILALQCQQAGLSVTLFDRDTKEGQQSCSYTGAGMLAPYAELEATQPIVATLGIESLALWPELLNKLGQPVFFQQNGSLIVAHPQDQADLTRFEKSLRQKLESSNLRNLARSIENRKEMLALEPDLPPAFASGLYLPDEGQIDNRQLLAALKAGIEQAGISWLSDTQVTSLTPGKVTYASFGKEISQTFDLVIDCRGLGSKPDLEQLRGVRGELLVLDAPEVKLNRPIRLMHPRHPIYVVPRENNRFIIGATTIESEDMRSLTVQSALELLSAACTIHPGFVEAIIVESRVNCRPAFIDNLPSIVLVSESVSDLSETSLEQVGLMRVNGLYRHGFLISPQLAKLVLSYIIDGRIDEGYSQIFHTEIFSYEVSFTKDIDATKELDVAYA